ncbi:DUF4328 domain-containing protein [Streptomyces olivoreticuli]|uniref:DUF4328 domain-containing protein n=1 Tax=Streptomyces olivoreticuli TaxID=68246 RepID=UPI000E27EC73|nr:DUF4328 domain-containing protein [Streptomyces olivoreticuli]
MSFNAVPVSVGRPARQPSRGWATAVTVLLALTAVADLFAVYADYNVYSLMGDVLSTSDEDLSRADVLYAAAGLWQAVSMLATAVVFIVWFHRARVNAEYFAQNICTMGRGWAIGAWFVPVANLWLPYRVARQVWEVSAQSTSDGSWRKVSYAPVKAWWFLWIGALAVDRIGSTFYNHADSAHALRQAATVVMISDLLSIAAAVFAILFVRKLTAMQEVSVTPEPTTAAR